MRIGIVVHGPNIIDSGYALKLIELLEGYGEVNARLGGTMGRTAVIDASLENVIDISRKLVPSDSLKIFHDDKVDVIFLLNYGKSDVTGQVFGYKVYNHYVDKVSENDIPVIQIERPGEEDGSIIAWNNDIEIVQELSERLDLAIVTPEEVYEDKLTLIAKDNRIVDIIGGELKVHGLEKLGEVDLESAIIKTGLLRKAKVTPRVISSDKSQDFKVTFLDHAGEDVYRFRDSNLVVTVGDDTTLISSDILYRFDIPVIGITDGDLDKVVEDGFKVKDSIIFEVESGFDDICGQDIKREIFKGKLDSYEFADIDEVKVRIEEIIKNINCKYKINHIN